VQASLSEPAVAFALAGTFNVPLTTTPYPGRHSTPEHTRACTGLDTARSKGRLTQWEGVGKIRAHNMCLKIHPALLTDGHAPEC
jgi:hypothetical protein